MNRLHRPARTALAASTLAVLALGLTACGGDDDDQAAPAPATVTVTEDAENPTDDASSDDRDRGDNTGGGKGNSDQPSGDALTAAARTALDAAGGTLVNLDLQVDGTWEADAVAQDGSETRVDVSADGREALGQRPDNDDAEDLADNQQLLGAGGRLARGAGDGDPRAVRGPDRARPQRGRRPAAVGGRQ